LPGKTGRGVRGKVPFLLAVQTRNGRPIFAQIRCVASFTKDAIRAYAERAIAAGSRVLSDGLGCWNGFAEAGLKHVRKVTGTYRSCDIQHVPRYLAAYEWRFNRRFELSKNLERFVHAALITKPTPYQEIIAMRPKTAEVLG